MADWEVRTIWQALDRSAANWPAAEAIVLPGERLTFGQLRDDVLRTAGHLHGLGLQRGDHVAILMGNSARWVTLLLAAATLGAVTVPINTRLRPPEVEYALRQAKVAVLLTADRLLRMDFVATLRQILPDLGAPLPLPALPHLRAVVVYGDAVPAGTIAGPEIERGPAPGLDPLAQGCRPDQVALIQYTSGTTAFPKGVMLTHDRMLRDAFHVGRRLNLRAGDRYLSQRPLFHVAGTTLSCLTALVAGACYVTTPTFDAGAALRLLEEEACTHLAGNDTMFLMMLGGGADRARFPALRGGWAAASPSILRRARDELGITGLCSAFGQSETSPNVSMGPWDDDEEKRLGNFSRPLPGVEVRIVDMETEAVLSPGAQGEIRVRGWNVMKGYFDMPEQTARAFDAEGWLRTGDLGVMDEDGRLRFVGRAKETIRVGGENVAPAEVEDVLHQHPAVLQAQVIGVPDPRLVEVPAAYVILKPSGAATPDELTDWCKERCAGFRVPRHVRLIESFEPIGMTGSAKVQKSRLREFALRDLGLAAEDAA
jgi:fatty-acyl-CoA synthase